jgi:hydrogenase maturation protein HypF
LQPPHPDLSRLRLEISGAVQGVGFRPFVYRLATDLGLTGWVLNDARGVFIEVEGPELTLRTFLERLPAEKPPLARIQSLDAAWLAPVHFAGFEIRHSDGGGEKTAIILPEVATCSACLAEILDFGDRRYGYAFTNCTNCGPRFSIITELPYDRPNTTMRRFVLCPECRTEYEDPADRRFHAQPTACPVCGPHLSVAASAGFQVPGVKFQSVADLTDAEAIRHATAVLLAGHIVAAKGLGGFHLMVDARNGAAVARLRERKPRRDKPFAVMAADLEQARAICAVSAEAEALLASPEAPIVLLPRRTDSTLTIAAEVAPDNPILGVMLAYTPLHHLLLRATGFPVVATSGNLTDEPICTDEIEAQRRLAGIADLFLIHDRPIARHVDDSVAWIVRGEPRLLRRARGYAPLPVSLPAPIPTILAVGGHLKNTIALSVGRQAFISQHIGDLETLEALTAFERVIGDFLAMYEAVPVAVAHDLHPDYASTRWALQQPSPPPLRPSAPLQLLPVQHHHAHLAACLADNSVSSPALGVIWDGTGYGPDGSIWGGEFLLGDAAGYERIAHLRPFRLPGGDAAIHEPRRAAVALLWEMFGEAALERDDLAPVRAFSDEERDVMARMLDRGLNSPVTTSMGRLFDGVSALIGLHQTVSFEGQAAMALEFAADPREAAAYPLPLTAEGPIVLDWGPLIVALIADLQAGVTPAIMAARFHNALVEAIVAVAERIGQPTIAFSGGCFQNRLLTERAAARLEQAGFTVLLHRQVPPNDGGISLGQLAVAAAQL